ncbi:hypothetical protein CDD83_1058 [Cordyceps sp. RAO-2017]|nr:hypothetical protein CDD83_1058 [Cordyceps sp. RAO-2017]
MLEDSFADFAISSFQMVDNFSSRLGWLKEMVKTIDSDHRDIAKRQGVKDISDVLGNFVQEAIQAAQVCGSIEFGSLVPVGQHRIGYMMDGGYVLKTDIC